MNEIQNKKAQTVKIDDTWSLEIGGSVTLIERTENTAKNAKNEFTSKVRGYYGHVDEALKSYLRKSINPVSEVSEIVELIESNVSKLKAKGLIR